MNMYSLLVNIMPGGDGTGPCGRGPMSGRGMGTCGRGRGRGYGAGYGARGRGAWGAPRYTEEPGDEREYLENLAKGLEAELKEIQKRLKELK